MQPYQKKKFITYINTGSMLINVQGVKKENMYEKFIKYKSAYSNTIGDQHLLNDISYGKIGYLPMKFGFRPPYRSNGDSDSSLINPYQNYMKKYTTKILPYIPKNNKYENYLQFGYNPVVVHQFNGKWMYGEGLTIYRIIAQYYIKMAGISDEIKKSFPGYFKKLK